MTNVGFAPPRSGLHPRAACDPIRPLNVLIMCKVQASLLWSGSELVQSRKGLTGVASNKTGRAAFPRLMDMLWASQNWPKQLNSGIAVSDRHVLAMTEKHIECLLCSALQTQVGHRARSEKCHTRT